MVVVVSFSLSSSSPFLAHSLFLYPSFAYPHSLWFSLSVSLTLSLFLSLSHSLSLFLSPSPPESLSPLLQKKKSSLNDFQTLFVYNNRFFFWVLVPPVNIQTSLASEARKGDKLTKGTREREREKEEERERCRERGERASNEKK